MALNELIVTVILLVICAVVILLIVGLCRLFKTWRFNALFGTFDNSEEKSSLTLAERHAAYMAPAENVCMKPGPSSNDFYQRSDSLAPEHDQGHVNQVLFQDETVPQEMPTETKESPVSVESMSVASDYEPPGGLQRAMSCESVNSDSSVMELEPSAPRIGQMEFGLEYDREVSELVVSVIQAKDLPEEDPMVAIDSHVKCWLQPYPGKRMQTKVVKETNNPVFMERFLFAVEPDDLGAKTVHFQVYSSDKYARQKFLGETDIKLGDIDLRRPLRVWMNLRGLDEKPAEFGDMMFSLSYLPTAERLTVVVVKARDLNWSSTKRSGDCFVKVYLLQNGKKIRKKKTATKKDERNPIFNEAMIFSVNSACLPSIQLRLSVVERLPEGKLSSIGHVIVGSQLTGTSLTHWNQMMSSLRKPVAMWHSLQK